jgi:hypothetical protein
MIRIAEELGDDHPPGYYDFRSDRAIAEDVLERVGRQAETLSKSDHHDDFIVDFAKTFRTMSQDRRAAWLRGAAVAYEDRLLLRLVGHPTTARREGGRHAQNDLVTVGCHPHDQKTRAGATRVGI